MNRSWYVVMIASIFEVGWVIGLKHAYDVWTWIGTAIAIYVSFYGLMSASKKLPVGTVYAVFVGMGTMGTVIADIVWFDEPVNGIKIFLILLLLGAVVGLKLVSGEKRTTSKGGEA
jgi:paired small multidrug resistance pump